MELALPWRETWDFYPEMLALLRYYAGLLTRRLVFYQTIPASQGKSNFFEKKYLRLS
jgi:hypothetical protein